MRSTTVVAMLALVGCTANDDIPAPTITTITPDHASPGATVTVLGDHFCQQTDVGQEDPLLCANTGSVDFNLAPASVAMYTEQMIVVEVPGLAPGSATVAVAVLARRSNSVGFVVDSP